MYTYNKDDKSYTFSTDDLDIEKLVELADTPDNNADAEIVGDNAENENSNGEGKNEIVNDENIPKKPTKIEVINGGNDLDISPVSDYLEIEKPRNEKKENIIIPEEKKD